MTKSILLALAGPNGSGKSTITSEYPPIGEYVNADDIQKHLQCDSLQAAIIAENTREFLLSQGEDFTFETVLSTPRNYNLMQRAKNAGYTVICIYVLTCNPNINVLRVKSRVSNGGHDVPSDKVKSRYERCMKLFPLLFEVCDELYVYDNSIDRSDGLPQMILKYQYGVIEAMPNDIWSSEMLNELCKGEYYTKE